MVDPGQATPSGEGEEGQEGLWDKRGLTRWGEVPGSGGAGRAASVPRLGRGGGPGAPAGRRLLIQPNNDEMAPLSCGAKVAVTGGGVT